MLLYWWFDGYIATENSLERYHGDLDLFINEKNLITLKELVDNSEDFKFVSNMNHKEIKKNTILKIKMLMKSY